MSVRAALLVAAGLAIAGCSTGDTVSPIVPVEQSAPRTMLVIGSNGTSGRGLAEPGRTAWPQLVFSDRFAPGDLMYQVLAPGGFAATALTEARDAFASLDPDVVVIWIGGRDEAEGTPIEAFEADLADLVDAASTTGAVVVVATLLDGHPDDDRDPAYNDAIRRTVAAAGANLADLADLDVARQPGDDSFLPSETGHRTIADAIVSALGAASDEISA